MSEVTKRTVATDALETLGTIIDDKQRRDAIHIAVLPVQAGERLLPGQDVAVSDGMASRHGKHVGIVDPFLKDPVREGERFWLLLYPRMVTSLRHVWSHPAFDDDNGTRAVPDAKTVALAALAEIASNLGYSVDALIEGATDHLDSGDYMSTGSREIDLPDEFWSHFETITGRKVDADKRYSFFSCSC